jgi:transcriptional regulator with XRE-family HTH domain
MIDTSFPKDLERLRTYPPFIEGVGTKLRQARAERGITGVVLGKAVGVDHSALSRLETGKIKSVGGVSVEVARELGLNYENLERTVWSELPEDTREAFKDWEFVSARKRGAARRTQAAESMADTRFIRLARDLSTVMVESDTRVSVNEFLNLLEHVLESPDPSGLIQAIADLKAARV